MKFRIIFIAILIAMVGLLGSCNSEKKELENTVLSTRITIGKDKWEVYKSGDKQQAIVVHNGKIVSHKEINVGRDEPSIMEIQELKDIQPFDLTTKQPYSKLVWDGTLQDGFKQLKFYEVMGYKTECAIEAQDYIDVYLSKDGKYKRVLILQGQISISDVNKFEFKGIDNYIQ